MQAQDGGAVTVHWVTHGDGEPGGLCPPQQHASTVEKAEKAFFDL